MPNQPEPESTEILARVLDDYEARGEPALAEACARHPELAGRIRDAAGTLRAVLAAAAGPVASSPASAAEPPLPSRIGRFRIDGRLGRGGMGTVYRAFDPALQRAVALKMLAQPLAGSPTARQRFDREAKALARLRHPAIVPVHEVGTTPEGLPFLVMDIVEAPSLESRLGALAPRPPAGLRGGDLAPAFHHSWPEAVARVMLQVADALDHAHAHAVVHRDVKPGNILVGDDGRASLVDFGIARALDDPSLTATGEAPGTPTFMAPEQADDGSAADARTDAYGLGATLYVCLTLRPPFTGRSREQLLARLRRGQPLPPRRHNAEVPRDLETICLTAMESEPSRRYQTAADLRQDLQRFLDYRPVAARPIGPLRRAARLARRNPLATTAIVLATLLVTGGPLSFAVHEANAKERIGREKAQTEREFERAERATAESLFRLATLATQRGDWEAAIAHYDAADGKGYPDQIETAIGRIEALEGSLQAPQALARLLALRPLAASTKHSGRVALLEADLAVNRLLRPDDKLDLVRQALAEGGLTPAEEGFARALLADSVEEALGHLRAARGHDPSYRRVNDLYGNLLLASGRTPEATEFAAVLRALYPHDPVATVYSAFVLALGRRGAEARALLERVRPQLVPGIADWAAFILEAARLVEQYDRFSFETVNSTGFGQTLAYGMRFLPFLVRSAAFLRQTRASDQGMTFRMAPCVVRAYREVLGATFALLTSRGGGGSLIAACRQAASAVGDGVFHFGVALCLLFEKRDLEAEQELLLALARPSLVVSRPTLRLQLLVTQVLAFDGVQDRASPAAAELRDRLRTTIGEVLAFADLPESHYDLLVRATYRTGDAALAREAVLRWLRAEPKSEAARQAATALESRR